MRIGITGGSCSGKTSLAHRLREVSGASVLSADDFFLDPASFPVVNGHRDWDRLDAIDWAYFEESLLAHDDSALVIAEGFLLMAQPEMARHLAVSFFVDCAPEMMRSRRLVREKSLPPEHYDAVIATTYARLIHPTRALCDYVLDGSKTIDELAWDVIASVTVVT